MLSKTTNVPFLHAIANIARGKSLFTPRMQYNHYVHNRLVAIADSHGCTPVTFYPIRDGDNMTAMLYFSKR